MTSKSNGVNAGDEPRSQASENRVLGDLGRFRVAADEFHRICVGPIPQPTMALLENSQLSQRKLALLALIRQLDGNPAAVGNLASPQDAWHILEQAERRAPDVVTDILLYPTVGVWLTRALHHTRSDVEAQSPWDEIEYFQLIAAAAAIRCDIPCLVHVRLRSDSIHLPTIGQLRVPLSLLDDRAELHCSGRGVRLVVAGKEPIDCELGDTTFSPIQRHTSRKQGQTLAITIDNLDPYRTFESPQGPSELDEDELLAWHKMLDEAWDILTLAHPTLAEELAAGLRAVTPIRRDLGIVGASSAAAFGAVKLSTSDSAIELAETLTHEIQHSKLNAVLSLFPLTTDNGQCRFYAPWRDIPRSLTGVIHGMYAFTCVVELMLALRDKTDEADLRYAEYTLAHRLRQVRATVNMLSTADELTEPGHHLVAVIDQRLKECERTAVAPELAALVELITADHHALWRSRFVQPDPRLVESVGDAWLAGASPAYGPAGTDRIVADDAATLPGGRRALMRTKALEPESFAHQVRLDADTALCLGDTDLSAKLYAAQVRNDPNDIDAWVGLGLTLRAQGHTGPADALLIRPELTMAALRWVRAASGQSPDPIEFIEWISSGS